MTMNKKLQMAGYLSIFTLSILLVIYALGFYTSLYDVTTGNLGGEAARIFNAQGEAQTFNKLLMNLSFYGVVFTTILLLFDSHKRKNFYKSNLIFTMITALFYIVVSIYLIIKVIRFRGFYMEVNFDFIAVLRGVESVEADPSVFNTGVVLGILLILSSIFVAYIAYAKTVETKNRFEARKALKGGVIHEQ